MSTAPSIIKILALIWLEYRAKMGDGCRNSNTRIAFGLQWAQPCFTPFENVKRALIRLEEVSMDELDQLILQTLQEDGRTPFTQIAEQAGVSETTIRSRYRSLEKAGIVRIVGVVDPFALGFQAPAIVGVSVDADKIDQVAGKIAEYPEVSYLVMTLGSSDLTIEVFCRDLHHLTDLITQGIGTIPGVRSTETLMIARSYKLSYRWTPVNNAPMIKNGGKV
jgi:Lrp/AsnC family transcriptional regulator for asnA, asnC and gidA